MSEEVIFSDERLNRINDGLLLIEKRDGLNFGSDAYLLHAYVRRQAKARLVDLGSGTGIIPLLLLARHKIASADAIEIQSDFAEMITRTASLNQLSDRLRTVCADIRNIRPDDVGGTVDIVTANPPYMNTAGQSNESIRKYIARHEVNGGIDDFVGTAVRLLKHGGLFYVVWRPDRLCDLLSALRKSSLEPKRMTFVHARVGLPPCLVLCEAKKGGSSGCYVTPPLILYTESDGNKRTAVCEKIYETGDFDEYFQKP